MPLTPLPEYIHILTKQWELTHVHPVEHVSKNFIFSAEQNQRSVIVKINPDQNDLTAEMHALKYYQNHGVVKLLATAKDKHALLLEHIYPGDSLKSFFPQKDKLAVEIAAKLMLRLQSANSKKHSIYSAYFKTLPEIVSVFETIPKKQLPEKLFLKAKKFSENLLGSSKNIILHGDLHHENILMSEKEGWIAIDPKGVIGDPAYEIGAFMCNPMPELISQVNIIEILKNRLTLFSDFVNIDIHRLYEWSYVYAMLAACWAIEDNQDPKYFIAVAEVLDVL